MSVGEHARNRRTGTRLAGTSSSNTVTSEHADTGWRIVGAGGLNLREGPVRQHPIVVASGRVSRGGVRGSLARWWSPLGGRRPCQIDAHADNVSAGLRWGVEPICRVLQVAPSTVNADCGRPPSARAIVRLARGPRRALCLSSSVVRLNIDRSVVDPWPGRREAASSAEALSEGSSIDQLVAEAATYGMPA